MNPCIPFHHVETIRAGLLKSLKHLPNAYAGFGFPAYSILKILKIYSEGLRRDVEKLAEAGSTQKASNMVDSRSWRDIASMVRADKSTVEPKSPGRIFLCLQAVLFRGPLSKTPVKELGTTDGTCRREGYVER